MARALWRRWLRVVLFRPYRILSNLKYRRWVRKTRKLRRVQRKILFDRIERNRDSQFGRDHGFREIASLADFRARVPITTYEDYEPYINKMKAGRTDALLGSDQKLVMFALTSGTHAARKFIPITEEYVKNFRRSWFIWGVKAARDHYGMLHGSIVQLAGDWDEFRTEAGTPCGNLSGLIAKMQGRLVRRLYCIPPEVGQIKDVTARHYVTLRLAVPRDVSQISTANPSTLVNLARLGDAEKEALVRDIADGTIAGRFDVPADVRARLHGRIAKPNPHRARELDEIISRTGSLMPKDYWPGLVLLGNWTGGAVRAYLRHYPAIFGNTPVRDIGLLASEGRMTLPIESGTASGVLDPTMNYYEFIPENEIHSPSPTVLEAHELVEGRNYFILLTTPSGFCRYNIHDLVRVTGWFNDTPLLEFLNKGSHVSSITGEKISESQVARAVDRALGELSLTLTAFTLAPVWDDQTPYYVLLVERDDVATEQLGELLCQRADDELKRINSEYESKRDTNRLGPVRIGWLDRGVWRDFCHKRLARSGGSLEQYKHRCLATDLDFVSQFSLQTFSHPIRNAG